MILSFERLSFVAREANVLWGVVVVTVACPKVSFLVEDNREVKPRITSPGSAVNVREDCITLVVNRGVFV